MRNRAEGDDTSHINTNLCEFRSDGGGGGSRDSDEEKEKEENEENQGIIVGSKGEARRGWSQGHTSLDLPVSAYKDGSDRYICPRRVLHQEAPFERR